MSNTDDLLAIAAQHGLWAQMYKGRFFVAIGEIMGLGDTLEDAIEAWCSEVERRGVVKKDVNLLADQ